VFLILFNPAQCYWFFIGYESLVNQSGLRIFKILGLILTIAYIIISIASFANFNGWDRVSDLFKADLIFTGVLSILESILFTLLYIFMGYTLFSLHKNPSCQ
jgi:hypothetical protein